MNHTVCTYNFFLLLSNSNFLAKHYINNILNNLVMRVQGFTVVVLSCFCSECYSMYFFKSVIIVCGYPAVKDLTFIDLIKTRHWNENVSGGFGG